MSAAASAVSASTEAPQAQSASGGAAALHSSTTPPSPASKHAPSWKPHIDFKYIRDHQADVEENCRLRNSTADVAKVVALYEEFVKKNMEVDALRAERNRVANSMKGKLAPEERQKLVEEGKRLKEEVASLEGGLQELQDQLDAEALRIPNTTHPAVPRGGEENMLTLRTFGSKPEFPFQPKDHAALGEALDIVDFETASEVSGTKFYYLRNEGVLLEMALINWALSLLVARGFTPVSTPDLVRSAVVEKCGFQPRGTNTQVYSIEGMDLCLAGTAEIPVGGMFMDKILADSELPIRVVALSHCFRTEAGAAGAATRGLYRVHQFSKLEMFVVSRPEESDRLHEELIGLEEELYSALGLHFETRDMPTEDLGAPAYRKYDVEAWMPGLGRYGEISSASNCTDYQARRLNIRYRPSVAAGSSEQQTAKPKAGKGGQAPTRFVHTLNATAVAVPRMIVAILETFQQEDGSVLIPEPLQPFMGGKKVVSPRKSEQ